jgi:hypothetical protein
MSISGAVAELDKEIAGLTKEIARLTQIRDSLAQGASKSATRADTTAGSVALAKKPGPRKKPGPKKSATVKKSVPAKATKRVISAETRKKMSDAAKARAAKKASAVK